MLIAPQAPIAILPVKAPAPTAPVTGTILPVKAPVPPIGVGQYATLRIGYALNGVKYQDLKVMAPITNAVASFTGSYADAVQGAQNVLLELAKSPAGKIGPANAEGAVALFNTGADTWVARTIFGTPELLRVLNGTPGSGGIASRDFTDAAAGLAALITRNNVVQTPSRFGNNKPTQ